MATFLDKTGHLSVAGGKETGIQIVVVLGKDGSLL